MIRRVLELLPLAPFLAGYAAGMVAGVAGAAWLMLLAMGRDL